MKNKAGQKCSSIQGADRSECGMRKKNARAVLMILAAGFCWGMIGVFSRPLSAIGLRAVQITFIRNLSAAVGMVFCILIRNRSLFRIEVKDIWMFFGTGLLSIVFFNICYFITIEKATLAAAAMLLYSAPCFVMLMSALFFKEKITGQKILALVMAFAGCALVSGFTGGQMAPEAILTGIGSGIGYALYSIFGTVALKKYHPFTVIFYTFLIAAVGIMPFSDVLGTGVCLAEENAWMTAGGLGVFSTLLPFLLYTKGLKHMEAGEASVLAFAEPMVATLAGIFLFKEALKVTNALGILLIFLAIFLLNIPVGKKAGNAHRTADESLSV